LQKAVTPEEADAVIARARALADATPPKLRLTFAQTFCAAALSHFWNGMRPRSRQALRPSPLASTSDLRKEPLSAAVRLAEVAGRMGVYEASYLVGRTYAAMLPDDVRSKNGVYYTPPAVVERLLKGAELAGVNWSSARALDPACGGGAFLGPLARRMVASLKGADRRVVLRNLGTRLVGYEIDPFAAWMSSVFLDATLHDELGFCGDDAFQPIQVCDSLTRPEPANFDLVIGNPPYGRVTLDATARALYKRSLFGHANLYGLFMDLALRKARPEGGVVAFVTPTGFLCGEYFKNLRALLGNEAPPVVLDFIHEREGVFDDVLQETLLAVFRKGGHHTQCQVSYTGFSGSTLTTARTGEALLPRDVQQPWVVARTPEAAPLATRLRSMPTRLVDWGYGVSTGPLVWNRFKGQLREKAGSGCVPLLWAEAVGVDGKFAFRAARRNHAPYFFVTPEDDFLLVRRPCVLLQRTTAKEQARRLIAAELPQDFLDEHGGAVTVENHVNMVLSLVDKPAVDTRTLAAFLNSAAADRAFRCISGTVAVSAYELESMPLPQAWALAELSTLLSRPHRSDEVEAYCSRLYGDR
jgi:adenine-specific DNA-methyltransferase